MSTIDEWCFNKNFLFFTIRPSFATCFIKRPKIKNKNAEKRLLFSAIHPEAKDALEYLAVALARVFRGKCNVP